jgi:hypothetical protein
MDIYEIFAVRQTICKLLVCLCNQKSVSDDLEFVIWHICLTLRVFDAAWERANARN